MTRWKLPTTKRSSAWTSCARRSKSPCALLCSNAGYNGDVEVAKALEAEPGYGLDCETGKYGNMISMGVADPAKVTVTALQAAASVAGLILITNCSITEADKKDEEAEEK